MQNPTIRGFTLVELSIVIIIIGLIVAGLMGGKTLIEQAKMRSVISKIHEYNLAFNTFKLQYQQLPGDMKDAQSFWPSCTDSTEVVNPCNGDGDGAIERAGGQNAPFEGLRAWQHLQLAGITAGNWSGDVASGTARFAEGINAPSTGLNNGLFRIDQATSLYQREQLHVISMASLRPFDGSLFEAAFTGIQAKTIEDKIDDSSPSSGKMVVLNGVSSSGCVNDDFTEASTTFVTPYSTDIVCRLFYYLDE